MKAVGQVAVLVILATGIATSAELPKYDIDSHCKSATVPAGTSQDMLMRMCSVMEQDRAKQVAARLDTFNAETFSRCDAEARTAAGGGSYTLLAVCLGIPSRGGRIEVTK